MNQVRSFEVEFVTSIPERPVAGRLYLSMPFSTAIHLCACGCGTEVVTPFRPGRWRLVFDGSVTIRPSIGNQGMACGSHYFIERNEVRWVPRWAELGRGDEEAGDVPRLSERISVFRFVRRFRRPRRH
jgi:hypothetical protein